MSQNTKASAKLSTGDRGPPHQPAGQFETRDRPHKPTKPLIPTAFPSKLFQIDIITAGRYIRTGPRVKRESSPGGKIRLGLPRKDWLPASESVWGECEVKKSAKRKKRTIMRENKAEWRESDSRHWTRDSYYYKNHPAASTQLSQSTAAPLTQDFILFSFYTAADDITITLVKSEDTPHVLCLLECPYHLNNQYHYFHEWSVELFITDLFLNPLTIV